MTTENDPKLPQSQIVKTRQQAMRRTKREAIQERFQRFDGTWGTRIRFASPTFDDKKKRIFLEEFSKHGMVATAAAQAGTTQKTVREHIKLDKDFGNAYLEAEGIYHDKVIAKHQDLIFGGAKKVTYDRDGNVIAEEELVFPQLVLAELKKIDPGYRDKQELQVTHRGGVMVAPSTLNSIDDWEKKYGSEKVIDVQSEVVEIGQKLSKS